MVWTGQVLGCGVDRADVRVWCGQGRWYGVVWTGQVLGSGVDRAGGWSGQGRC